MVLMAVVDKRGGGNNRTMNIAGEKRVDVGGEETISSPFCRELVKEQ